MRRSVAVFAVAASVAVLLSACEKRDVNTVKRPHDAVVLTGAQVPGLVGASPGRVVAFAFAYGTWEQKPVQVDERAVLDLAKPKNAASSGKTALFYTDPTTWTGADPDATFDADDEVSFMASEAGGEAHDIDDDQFNVHVTVADPPHTVPGSGVKVQVSDPLVAGSASWIYLYRSDGTLDPAAGAAPLVDYHFNLLSGDYKTTYQIGNLPNPENSVVTTAAYSAHFSDRWIFDQLHITAGGATGTDILDLQKFAFIGSCGRSEYTFRVGGGAMIANKSGPIRAIRSFLGANSGTYTQRDHIMYADHMDIVTYLRVHPVPASREWIDYSAAAIGMQYVSSTDTTPVTIDGVPDASTLAVPAWELVRGAPGSVVNVNTLTTDIAGASTAVHHYYSDTTSPTQPEELCTGDSANYGASGSSLDLSIPNTDPTLGPANTLINSRSMTFLAPDAATSDAATVSAQRAAPLTTAVTPFVP